jgi:hypothetical protein
MKKVISPSSMQQGAAKKPYSVSAHENEAVFVNDLSTPTKVS